MRHARFLAPFVLTISFISGVAAQTPFAIKPGLWEMSISSEATARISPALLRQLRPEQTALLKRELAASLAHVQRSKTYKDCITPRELERGIDFPTEDSTKQCKRSLLLSTPTVMDMREQCTGEGNRATTMHIQSIHPEAMRADVVMQMTDNKKTLTTNSIVRGRWLGEDCGSVP